MVNQDDPDGPVKKWADNMAASLYGAAVKNLPAKLGTGMLVDVSPGIFPQYDDQGLDTAACENNREVTQYYHLRGADDWTYMLDTAGVGQRWIAEKHQIRSNCEETVTKNTDTSILWIYSFNEWGEGAGIETLRPRTPSYPFGFADELLTKLNEKVGALSTNQPPSSPPPSPVARSPLGTVEGLRPGFVWDGVQFGDKYHLIVYDSARNAAIETIQAGTSLIPSADLTGNERHTWQVRGHTPAGWGPLSTEKAFTPIPQYTTPPDAPTPLAPLGCTTTARPTFTWTAANRATSYKIFIEREDTFQTVVYQDVDGTSYVPPLDLASGVLHRWKVKGRNSAGETWSPSVTFTAACPVLSIDDVTITEGNAGTADAVFTVSLSVPSTRTVTVDYATTDGPETCTPAPDYTPVSGTLTLPPGSTTQTIHVPVAGDTMYENNEIFYVDLANSQNATLARARGQGTIMNDDPMPAVSIAAVAALEGDPPVFGSETDAVETDKPGYTQARLDFPVSLSAPTGKQFYLYFSVWPGTAIEGTDYRWTPVFTQGYDRPYGVVAFSCGNSKRYAYVNIIGDRYREPDETLFVKLHTRMGTLPFVSAQGTILNDD